MIYKYSWGNNPKRQTLKGRKCIVLCLGKKRSIAIKFVDNDQIECVSSRSIRKIDGCPCERFNERAAIMEFDGCLDRTESERFAAMDICSNCDA